MIPVNINARCNSAESETLVRVFLALDQKTKTVLEQFQMTIVV